MVFLVFFSMASLLAILLSTFVIKHNRDIKFLDQRRAEQRERERLAANIHRLEINCGLVNPEPNWLLKKRYLG